MLAAESATKQCCQCHEVKPRSAFYSRKDRSGIRVPFSKCKACYAPANRLNSASYNQRKKAERNPLKEQAPPPPMGNQPPIPLSERVARVQRDAQELTWILRRYMLRDRRSGVCYIRLRPNEDDPKRRAIAVAVEKLVCAVWDSGIGNSKFGFKPIDPRTNEEVLDSSRR